MAAPVKRIFQMGSKLAPVSVEKLTREEPYPVTHGSKPPNNPAQDLRMLDSVDAPERLYKGLADSAAMELNIDTFQNGETGSNLDSQTDSASSSPKDLVISSPSSDYIIDSPKNLTICSPSSTSDTLSSSPPFETTSLSSVPSTVNTPAQMFMGPIAPNVMNASLGALPTSALEMLSPDKLPRPPWKGVMVPCGQLKEYLDSVQSFNRKCMLRKGREVHKIYVDMVKGECFLDDQFSYTEFGKLVLTNGSIRAGRAKNAKQIVVARETLYCSGMAMCKRMCGGYGVCIPGCDKTKMRGHRCAYRIKLTQRLGYVNFWFVEVLGTHDQIGTETAVSPAKSQTKDENEKKFRPVETAMDLTSAVKIKKNKKISAALGETTTCSINSAPDNKGNIPQTVSETQYGVNGLDIGNNYHYVLGLMPASQSQNPTNLPENSASLYSSQIASQRALDIYRAMAAQMAANVQANNPSHVTVVTPTMPEETNTNNGAIPTVLPSLVSVKTEPQDDIHQGHGQLYYPMPPAAHSSPTSQSPSRKSHSHSPSPSRGQGHGLSPLAQGQGLIYQPSEAQNEVGHHQMQAQQEILGQVHNQIMERARSRKRGRSLPQKYTPSPDHDLDTTNSSQHSQSSLNIPTVLNTSTSGAINSNMTTNSAVNSNPNLSSNPTIDIMRFQTLNRILQSEAFQAARQQLENSWRIAKQSQDSALNLTQESTAKPQPSSMNKHDKKSEDESGLNYLKLLDEWRRGGQLQELLPKRVASTQNHQDETKMCDLEELSEKEKELVSRVRQLESHVRQLQNIVIKANSDDSSKTGRKKAQREFDFTKYNTRHVALKVAYLGFDYQGYASVEDSDRTIEHHLFEALKKTRLVEARETANYSRCGRTDKGVSAFGQVISLDLRTNFASGRGVKVRGGSIAEKAGVTATEVRYPHILNKVLPPEIRILAWAPVDPEFNARFSCKRRTYKYIFPKGDLDLELLRTAAAKLVGEHDFRNFCKMDIGGGVTNYVRKIISVDVIVQDESGDGYTMCELTIVGTAFLWHQIRCIMALFVLVAKGKESPEIIDELLDIEKNERKPQYTLASEIPLVLFENDFGDGFEWIYEADTHEDNIKHFQQMWAQNSTKAAMVKRFLEDMDKAKVETECDIAPWSDLSPPILNQASWMHLEKARKHRPLKDRPTCDSLEDRLEAFAAKKRKLENGESAVTVGDGEITTREGTTVQEETSVPDETTISVEDQSITPDEIVVEEKDSNIPTEVEMDTSPKEKE